jgi:hypothetical protein
MKRLVIRLLVGLARLLLWAASAPRAEANLVDLSLDSVTSFD